jgi:transcriptional regulator with XRE-family HTH domain
LPGEHGAQAMEGTQQRRNTIGPTSAYEIAPNDRKPTVRAALGSSDSAAFDLSKRLWAVRKEHGLSLDALALKTGMTKGFLSLIERGLKVPSISTLLKLSQAYGISVSALLDTAKSQEPIYSLVKRGERRKYAREGSPYGYRYEAIAFHKERKRMEPFVVQPPLRLPRNFFQHQGDEMVYVLEGNVEIHLEREHILLEAGDCLYFDAATRHRSRSVGPERAVTLVVVTAQYPGG